ncbi:hypothetical protein [Collinsella sp. AF18-8]|jgi:hypothetical protein|uniref:hypothetical protein n=1 Tax=Collinsella sp. AF18-8 TaxID=2292217 RepID=UPI0011C19277|nr:hypothetical protein [Collinsella sp. AF18-8]
MFIVGPHTTQTTAHASCNRAQDGEASTYFPETLPQICLRFVDNLTANGHLQAASGFFSPDHNASDF